MRILCTPANLVLPSNPAATGAPESSDSAMAVKMPILPMAASVMVPTAAAFRNVRLLNPSSMFFSSIPYKVVMHLLQGRVRVGLPPCAALMLTIDYSPETRKEQQQHHGAPYKQAAQPRDGWKARNSPETQPSAIEKMAWQAQLMLYADFLCLVSEPVYLLPTPAVCTCPWEP